ncbi:MAG: hypothetical protein ACI9U2_002906 [Bradymonadia bacterium]|jgi:hypothetical protein
MSERGYKVRIRPPERGDVGMLIAMIGPLVDLDPAELSRALAKGPAIVGDDMARGEAEQLMGVFTSLGADAELLLPDGTVNTPEPIAASKTLPLHAKSIATALDAVTARNATQPFDTRMLRAKVAAAHAERRSAAQATTPPAGSAMTQTQPFNARALRAAANQLMGSSPPDPLAPMHATSPQAVGLVGQIARAPLFERREGDSGLPAPRAAQGDRASNRPQSRPASERPLPGESLRGADSPRNLPMRSSVPPRDRTVRSTQHKGLLGVRASSLPPPVRLEGLPPIEPDALEDSVNTASVAFASDRQRGASTPPRGYSHPPGPVAGSHPQPNQARGDAIRERVQDAQAAPVDHSVGVAVLLAVLLPGMGQLYNGQRNRAVWFAVSALLLLPWLWAIVDAGLVAHSILERQRRRPSRSGRRAALPGQIVLDIAVFVALAGGLTLLAHAIEDRNGDVPIDVIPLAAAATTASAAPQPPPQTAVAAVTPGQATPRSQASTRINAPVSAAAGTVASAATRLASPSTVAAPPSAMPVARHAPVSAARDLDQLLAAGRTACGEGRFAECESLMRVIIKDRSKHREAHQLLVDAISQQGPRGSRSSPSSVAPMSATP